MPLGYFPAPRPDETIYSLCAKFHRATGISVATTSNLLQMPGAHAHPAVPVALKFIAEVSNGMITASEETLRERTQLRSFIPLMPPSKRQALVESCTASGSTVIASARAGMNRYTHSRRLLRYCHECAKIEFAEEGIAYWHASVQAPGTWLCIPHGTVLSFLRQTSRRRGWALPPAEYDEAEHPSLDVGAQLKLLRLKESIAWIGAQRSLETTFLQVMLRMRVRRAGHCRSELKWTQGERAHMSALAAAHWALIQVPDVKEVAEAPNWFEVLFRDCRHYDPLTWAMALSWVGSTDAGSLDDEYGDARARKPPADLFGVISRECHRSRAPSIVYDAFKEADSKADAVTASSMSEFELDGWLRRDPELKPHWEAIRKRRRREECSREIRALLCGAPDLLRVDVLRNCTAAYRWLEVNDPKLLTSLLPAPLAKFARQQAFCF